VTVPTEFSIGEAAAIVGVHAHTLRAWERRYAVVLPSRSRSNQRRYTIEDIRLLRAVKEAIGERSRSVKRVVQQVGSGHGDAAHSTAAPRPALSSSRQSVWRTAMDLVPVIVLLVGPDGQVVDTNAAAEVDLGVPGEQLRGRPFVDLVAPDQRGQAAEVCFQPLRERRGLQLQVRRGTSPMTYVFDCWPVRTAAKHQVLVVVGHQLAS